MYETEKVVKAPAINLPSAGARCPLDLQRTADTYREQTGIRMTIMLMG
jgi:hypothetical protein